jgi:hypothetical protein
MVDDMGTLSPVEADEFPDRGTFAYRTAASPDQADGQESKSLASNLIPMIGYPRRDGDIESGCSSGFRQVQTVGPEIPVFGD